MTTKWKRIGIVSNGMFCFSMSSNKFYILNEKENIIKKLTNKEAFVFSQQIGKEAMYRTALYESHLDQSVR